jgi:tetratricopeptide (TPR) repeat protein
MGGEAAAAIPTDDPRRPFALSSLGVALRIRFEVSGASTDLDAAIKAGQAAIGPPSSVAADRAIWLTNLAIALWHRAERTGVVADLDAAVDASREAVQLTPTGHPSLAKRQANLGSALATRFKYGQRATDLDDAIEALRGAAEITPSGHPSRPLFLSNLARALRDRFSQAQAVADLDEAIEAGRVAVAGTPVDDPHRATRLSGLGTSLLTRAADESDPALAAEACGLFREAVEQTTAAVDTRIDAARKWAGLAIYAADWPQALTASTAAMELLPILAWHGLDRQDQLHAVSAAAGVAADGAAVALRAGEPEAALTLLEQGRGILLSHAINARSDLSLVAQQAPELAWRMQQVRAELDSTGNTLERVESLVGPPHLAERRRHLAQEWDRLVDEARKLRGLRQFLRAPSFVDLQSAAAGGTVVVINTSRIRCDALLLTERGLDVLPLPRLDVDEIARRATILINALSAANRSAADRASARRSLVETLAWLWDAIAEPVLMALGLREPIEPGREHPRIWWCPTGILTFLPVHAAGHYELDRGPDEPPSTISSLPDFAVSSYTPTLRALIDSKNRTASRPCRPLTLALPITPGLAPLPRADGEARDLDSRVPGGTMLIGPAATRDELLQRLPQHNCLHFAGHGSQDPADLSGSALYCYDHQANGPVTLDDIAGLRLANADLAFLSACETAVGATQIPDEAMHMAGGLLAAGFAHVVATHWSVGDAQSARAARVFYNELSRPYESGPRLDLTRTATAVHKAVCHLRDRYADPVLWAPYVHIGG